MKKFLSIAKKILILIASIIIALTLAAYSTYQPIYAAPSNNGSFHFEDPNIGYSVDIPQKWKVITSSASDTEIIVFESFLKVFYEPEICTPPFPIYGFQQDKTIKAVFAYLDDDKNCPSSTIATGIIVGLEGFTPPTPIPALVLAVRTTPRVTSSKTVKTANGVTVGVIEAKDEKNYPNMVLRFDIFALEGGSVIIGTIYPLNQTEIIRPYLDQMIVSINPLNDE